MDLFSNRKNSRERYLFSVRRYVFLSRSFTTERAPEDSPKESPKESEQPSTKDQDYEEKIRHQILKASLPFVIKHGWSKAAISEGAQTLGYPGVTHGMFQNSGADLISFFYLTCNNELTEYMKNATKDNSKKIEPKEFIQDALERRLRMMVPYIDKWPEAIGIMALPPNVPVALANLLTLVDDVCHYAGDKSVDFSWYSRRIAVAGIYNMTELCLIQDKSKDYEETWKFLKRRLDEAVQIQKILRNSGEVTSVATETILATFTTVSAEYSPFEPTKVNTKMHKTIDFEDIFKSVIKSSSDSLLGQAQSLWFLENGKQEA